jgi:hypothetical protein
LFALDAKSGKPIKTFGKGGQASVILDVIRERNPEVTAAITLGYWFTTLSGAAVSRTASSPITSGATGRHTGSSCRPSSTTPVIRKYSL